MPFEEVQRLFALTKGSKDSRVERWREKAWLQIKIRTGEYPEDSPYWWDVPKQTAEVTPPPCR